jgi:hypothetical protein
MIVNSAMFAHFLSISANTLNKHLKQDGFILASDHNLIDAVPPRADAILHALRVWEIRV